MDGHGFHAESHCAEGLAPVAGTGALCFGHQLGGGAWRAAEGERDVVVRFFAEVPRVIVECVSAMLLCVASR